MTFNDTFFLILSFNLLLISLLKAFYWRFSKQLFLSVFAQRYANQYLKEENVFTQRITLLVTTIMFINLSLFLAKSIYGANLTPIDFWNTGLILAVFFITKTILIRLLGHIFLANSLAKLAVYFSFLFDRVMGIILFPIIVFMFFSPITSNPILFKMSIAVIILFLSIKLFWIWRIGIGSFGLSKIYLFLYLCMLEIFPLLVFSKAVFY